MQEKNFVKSFRTVKVVQLCILLVLDITSILLLICNPSIGKQIFPDKVLLILCAIIWILMLNGLGWLFYDFYKIKSFAEESHALNKVAYLDHLTGIPNRHGLDAVFKTYDSPKSLTEVGCLMGTIANLPSINDTQGHAVGDLMILDFCNIFEEVGDNFGFVGRNGGNEYIMVADHCTHDTMQNFIHCLNERIVQYNTTHEKAPIDFQYTYLLNTETKAQAFTQLLTATYNKLHS
uniref:GGDEF domain-containing protein n=1 Tax=Acetatifactor sp. TaxID=1872090 RepID=UPI004055D701